MSLKRWNTPDGRPASRDNNPLDFARGAIAFLLGGGTVIALALALTGVAPRALLLAGALWAIYGVVMAILNGVLEPLVDFLARLVHDVGLMRGSGFSEIETLVARGEYEFAASRYHDRADQDPHNRAEAIVRRAALLTGPLRNPELAVQELEALRQRPTARLSASDDILVGTALADLYEHRLNDPGRAMVELRRLVDRYPRSHHARRLRMMLAALRRNHFGAAFTSADSSTS